MKTISNEKTYKIVGRTNSWIAQRDIHFDGKTVVTLHEDLTLKEAQALLFKMYREDYKRSCATNWGLAVVESNRRGEGAGTYKDGTRYYTFDSRTYSIEQE